MSELTREERLNNPMGVEHEPGTTWEGQADEQPDSRFVNFKGPGWGMRAGFRCLRTAIERDGINTIGGLVAHWAPEEENDTTAYEADVCERCGYSSPAAPITAASLTVELGEAVIIHENGRCIYSDEDISAALAMALA
jgi:hypothetical protein